MAYWFPHIQAEDAYPVWSITGNEVKEHMKLMSHIFASTHTIMQRSEQTENKWLILIQQLTTYPLLTINWWYCKNLLFLFPNSSASLGWKTGELEVLPTLCYIADQYEICNFLVNDTSCFNFAYPNMSLAVYSLNMHYQPRKYQLISLLDREQICT